MNARGALQWRRIRSTHPVGRGSSGFTITELLVAMGITLILAALVLAVVVRTGDVARRVSDSLTLSSRTQQVCDRIESDCQCVLRRRDANTWLTAQTRDNSTDLRDRFGWSLDVPTGGTIKPAGPISLDALAEADTRGGRPGEARFGMGGCRLCLVALGSDARPHLITCQIQRRKISDAASGYFLMRSDTPLSLNRPPAIDDDSVEASEAPGRADILAEGVVDFGVWLGRRDTSSRDGVRCVYPRSATDTDSFSCNGAPGSDYAGRNPDCVDIIVRFLTSEGIQKLSAFEAGQGRRQAGSDTDWWNLVRAHSTVVVRRIEFKSVGW
ncbi:MAG TPA: prepilin-type N-terminal cleavage/methylation domain-containing protein [Candidatus Didemnitutus sp.]|nr:prepilin-type N-terminal cleavage/methylation domain-containing protein [Candidatus Didemnitutus sp.]